MSNSLKLKDFRLILNCPIFGGAYNTLGRQIKDMQSVLSGVTFQATSFLLQKDNWDLLEDFDEITNEVATISERVSEQESITKSDLDEIKQLFRRVEIKIDQKDKDFFSILLKWITIVSFIMMLVQEKRFYDSKDETLTRKDFEEFKTEVTQTIKDKLTKIEDVRTIGRDCNLRLKPSNRTLILGTMSKGDKVIILQTSSKWVYIQMKDDLTTHGWVYKKYVNK